MECHFTIVTIRNRNLYFAFFFFFNDPATPEIYTLSLHDALPNSRGAPSVPAVAADARPCGRRPSVTAMAAEDVRDRVRRHVEVSDSEGDHAAGRPAIPAAAAVAGGTGGAVSTLASHNRVIMLPSI